ncbi:ATP-binding protein [Pleurocapsa sp. PCC 7319]|uniref:hybrid sensor histidine kinase/response regulator n=1 Tax=Pleurocapsa sp. PCC 7319 TaxID=118161 RepID=UPI0003717D31|nr:ATP-binding protein [Pleurocapsa sp. PCC 7319]
MRNSSTSLVLRRIVNHQVWLNLVELWLAMAKTEDKTLLATEDTLLKLTNNDNNIHLNKQLETDKFFLLITSKLNALLRREKTVESQKYQITIAFDRLSIVEELIQLSYQNKWEVNVLKYLQTEFLAKLSSDLDDSSEFIVKVVELLINEADQTEHHYNYYPSPPMDKILHYQVEQERIFDRIKIQISQNLNLSEIIQTAINHGCRFLELDRLLIYQLDVPLQSHIYDSEKSQLIDTVTFEAKKNENIVSTLDFQDEICQHQFSKCKNKYQQKFSLVINDVEVASNLNPCLQSLMRKLEVKAKAVIPINVEDKLWGLIIAHQCHKPRQWHHQDIQFLRQIAEYLAIAIHHNQSYQQLQQQKLLLEKQVKTQAQQIKDALIAAEAASKSKHEFLGSMSHELRTPLTCVIGLSSTLLQWSSTKERVTLSPEKQQQYLHLIQQSGKHLLALINNILEFSEVESGKHLLNIKQISLTEVTKQSLQILQETAIAKQIILSSEIRLENEQDFFYADQIRLKEILFNLLSNGIKFTPEQGTVILRVWREKRQVVFQVEDTGIGIAPAEIPLLFEKFKQLENFRQRTHGGTGLGLALTKKLVELHGGMIEVESALGQGTIFTVYFPEKTPFKASATRKLPAYPQVPLGSKTIMLITEDEEHATFICQLLTTIEYQVIWLMDAAMAVNQIELLQPSAIIIDRDCSEIEVKTVAKAINHKHLLNNTSLVLLSDSLNNHEWQRFSRYGVNDYLLKSMNPTQIINKMNNLIKTESSYIEYQDNQG